MALTATDLLHGAIYAIEQAGQLLHDAVSLYREKRYSTAAALAVLCREELGRADILFELHERALKGEVLSAERVRFECDDHVEKLRRGRTGTTIRWGTEDRHKFEGLLKNPQSEEYQRARLIVDEMVKRKAKREPHDAHQQRQRALYVEPNEGGGWNRPCEYSKRECRELVEDVANDYALHDRTWILDPKIAEALNQWKERPQLPPRIWPVE